MKDYVFTSESVSSGHPDKVCDRVSDSLLDYFFRHHNQARTAIECFATTNRLIVGGEYKSTFMPKPDDLIRVVRDAVRDIGYEQQGFHWKTMDVEILLHSQSPDIAQGVDENSTHPEGAGDQGIMFGYASNETNSYMPAAIHYAHAILKHLENRWRSDPTLGLGPDAKSQVTLRYQDGIPIGCENILVSVQHRESVSLSEVRSLVRQTIEAVLPKGWMCSEDKFYVNPTGRFVIGGPEGDAGLTGRKIVVDTYGGTAPHGGGAFSGKDPTKVDRSGAYAARYLAKNIVAAGLAKQCLIQLAYAIGIAKPLAIHFNCFGTAQVDVEKALLQRLPDLVDLSPKGIRRHLDLNRPIYTPTSSYGHFGQEPTPEGSFSWEKLDLVDQLQDMTSDSYAKSVVYESGTINS